MGDTPRTDGAVMIVECAGRRVAAVHADLARDLEREAVQARKEVNEARWGHSVQVEALRKQISQLTEDLVAAKRDVRIPVDGWNEMMRERKELGLMLGWALDRITDRLCAPGEDEPDAYERWDRANRAMVVWRRSGE